jgi:AcrR family transcriptional regulator
MVTKQERARQTRQALVHSASQEFERHGYAETKLSDISARAGVSAGALHFHFENKAAVAVAVEQAATRILRATVLRAYRQPRLALQKLVDSSHLLAQLFREHSTVRAGFRLSLDSPRRAQPSLLHEWQSCVRRLLTEADLEGELLCGVPLTDMASAVVGATMGFETLAREDWEWLSLERVAGFWRLLLPRLATPEALGGIEPYGLEPAAGRADPASGFDRCGALANSGSTPACSERDEAGGGSSTP